jgi:hypothetical protein
MAVAEVRWEGMVQSRSAQRLVAQRVVFFTSYALAGLVLPFSSFFMLWEWYGL